MLNLLLKIEKTPSAGSQPIHLRGPSEVLVRSVGKFHIYDMQSGKKRTSFGMRGRGNPGPCRFSPDGSVLAASSGATLFIRETDKYKYVHTLKAHDSFVSGVAFIDNETLCTVAQFDRHLAISDLSSGEITDRIPLGQDLPDHWDFRVDALIPDPSAHRLICVTQVSHDGDDGHKTFSQVCQVFDVRKRAWVHRGDIAAPHSENGGAWFGAAQLIGGQVAYVAKRGKNDEGRMIRSTSALDLETNTVTETESTFDRSRDVVSWHDHTGKSLKPVSFEATHEEGRGIFRDGTEWLVAAGRPSKGKYKYALQVNHGDLASLLLFRNGIRVQPVFDDGERKILPIRHKRRPLGLEDDLLLWEVS